MARLEIPLRENEFSSASQELQIQSLQSSIFQLRTDLATHSHLPTSGISGGGVTDQIIGANFDFLSRYVLKDFAFESDKYAGALKSGTITWSATTGLVTGGTGFVINDKGIIGALAGATTVSILNDGTASFAGTLSAASGTLGAITIGTNAWHVDSSGNMWWGSFTTYAAASVKISTGGSAFLATASIDILTAPGFQTSADGTRIYTANDNFYADDINATAILQLSTSTFSNGVLYIAPATNNVSAIELRTSLITATAATLTIANDGLSESLTISSTRATNSDPALSINQVGSGYAISVIAGISRFRKGVKIDTNVQSIDIDTSFAGASITIDETATTTTTSSIFLTTARPCSGITLDMNHATNIQSAINILYAGDGVAFSGIVHIKAEKTNNVASCIGLEQVASGKAHINFSGDPANNTPSDGDLWFDGAELYLRIGATTYKLDKTSI